ncbi:GntR family transcriptional regulator [Actinoallomurus sp. NPDC050550]|uniref:GntR family transcriptional regulator n=1 Tax=Actinoallomurus sp. NPDC050550 TaxID=3154937 RepID=UPI0033E3A2BC
MPPESVDAVTESLIRDRSLLSRTSTTERVAAILRDRITEGLFRPGDRLVEETIGTALGVSRNTLREAFRLLSHERLLDHRLNRGVFVRELSVDDVVDLFRVRRLVECTAIRHADTAPAAALRHLREAVESGEHAATDHAWLAVGTANMRFHQAVVELAGSARLEEMMRQVLAELRLVFHVMNDPRTFHEPYLARNRDILKLVEAGDRDGSEAMLSGYLTEAERQLVGAYSLLTR